MVDVRIHLDTRDVKDALKALRREGPKAVADAMNRVGFEILDAEEIEVRGAFQFASPNTQRFLARSFRFQKATADSLKVTVYPLPGSRSILERQTLGATVKPGPDIGPVFDQSLAVPQDAIQKTQAGRVPAARHPSRLLRRTKKGGRSRAYIAGRAVFERIPGQKLGRFLFALAQQAKIKPELRFFQVAADTARKHLPLKAARVLEKINLRRGR